MICLLISAYLCIATPPTTQEIITYAAQEFSVDAQEMLYVAYCESRYNPRAYNRSGATGLFQFMPLTFKANARRLGYTEADIWSVGAQARVAAEMFSRHQQFQWECKG